MSGSSLEQSLDPRELDSIHVEPLQESRPDVQAEGLGRDPKSRAARDDSRGIEGIDSAARETQGREVHRSLGERLLLREVDRVPRESDRRMESLAPFRGRDGRAIPEGSGHREVEGAPSRKREDEDRRVHDQGAKRSRKGESQGLSEHRGSEGTRHRDRQRERGVEPPDEPSRRSRTTSAGPDDGRSSNAEPSHGTDGGRDVEGGGPPREERLGDPEAASARHRSRSRTPPPSHLEEILLASHETQVNGVEIILNLSARDVHLDRRGKGRWVVNAIAKRGAEIQFKQLSEKDTKEFLEAKRKEVNSYIENMAVSIAQAQGVDPQRILGMRWVLVGKNITDEEGVVAGQKAKARLIVKGSKILTC